MDRIPGLLISAFTLLMCAEANAEDSATQPENGFVAYATRDSTGTWSFSDIPDPNARTISLPQSQARAPTSEELVEQMLQVAASLEAARLARENSRGKRTVTEESAIPAPQPASTPYYYPQRRYHQRPPISPEQPSHPPRENRRIRFPTDF